MDGVLDRIRDILVEQLGVKPEDVTLEASFQDDLGADSLDVVELVMAFEEEFDIKIPTKMLKRSAQWETLLNTSKPHELMPIETPR